MVKKEILIDPVTRIEGHMAVHANIDVDNREVSEAYTYATMFRGFEIILKNRDPPDAVFITQRVCGVCPVPHAYASAMATDMALKTSPPPLAITLRNLTDEAEILYDHPIHLFQLAGPEYSAAILNKFNKAWYNEAKDFSCEYKDLHGYSHISDLMDALSPLTGQLYLYTLKMERYARKLVSLIAMKHPHINAFVPGGISRTWTANEAAQALSMTLTLSGFMKLVMAVWEDISNFLYSIGYEEAGARPANLIAYGVLEDPETYDAKYENMSKWGDKKAFSPGVVVEGKLITHDLKEINLGVREYETSSFYDGWSLEFDKDPEGNPLDQYHLWNKETAPRPQARDFLKKYSWGFSPRWFNRRTGEGYVLEAGPLSRLYTTALAGRSISSPFSEVRAGNGKITVDLPMTKSELLSPSLYDPISFEWKIPSFSKNGVMYVNAIERLRARAFSAVYYAAIALLDAYRVLAYMAEGKTKLWTPFERPKFSMGVGLVEAARGALGHWIVVKDGKIHRYQIITPTGWNVSPKDAEGRGGPIEEAVKGTPITEDHEADDWTGVDILRVVRSFDPCLACTVHTFVGDHLVKTDLPVYPVYSRQGLR